VSVPWDQKSAFERFTVEFGSWWPVKSHSIGGDRVERVVFEPFEGGRIYEEHEDGRRFQWGQVMKWEPPRLVKFTWHPSRDASTAQQVEVMFTVEGDGTRLDLVSTGWENWGPRARRARNGYNLGWGYVLNVWVGKRSVSMSFLDMIAGVATFVQKFRGGADAQITSAGGELPRA
jgi:uncharacterized protein YndB with AHSA1/START domain